MFNESIGNYYRITTNGTLRTYRSGLMGSRGKLNDAMTKVMTQRQFNSYAEDPSKASKAWQLRRSIWRTQDQIRNVETIIGYNQEAFTAIDQICDGSVDNPGLNGYAEMLQGANMPTGSGRTALGRQLLTECDSIVMMMNAKYGDNYVFAGSDGLNAPFTWGDEAKTKILFRGVEIPDSKPRAENYPLTNLYTDNYSALRSIVPKDPGDPQKIDDSIIMKETIFREEDYNKALTKWQNDHDDWVNGKLTGAEPVKPTADDFTTEEPIWDNEAFQRYKEWMEKNHPGDPLKLGREDFPKVTYIFDSESFDAAMNDWQVRYDISMGYLNGFAEEKGYVDIGMGLQEDDKGNFITSTGYDAYNCGVSFLGFGVDEDGDSQNIVMLMKEAGNLLVNADPDSGEMSIADESRLGVLINKILDRIGNVSEKHVELSTKTDFLYTTQTQLNLRNDSMDEQREGIEGIEPADAITQMSWANYCYQAALKIGNTVLSQSLLDYMS